MVPRVPLALHLALCCAGCYLCCCHPFPGEEEEEEEGKGWVVVLLLCCFFFPSPNRIQANLWLR